MWKLHRELNFSNIFWLADIYAWPQFQLKKLVHVHKDEILNQCTTDETHIEENTIN